MSANPTVSITGAVYQSRNGENYAIPGAAIQARNIRTQAIEETTTDDRGYYSFPRLPVGQWSLSAQKHGLVATPVETELRADADSVNFEMTPGIKVRGAVYRHNSSEPISGAMIKAVNGDTSVYQSTDADGAFAFNGLRQGVWSFTAMHEESQISSSEAIELTEDKLDLRFDLFRSMSTADADVGRRFFGGLLGGFCILIALYIFLHAVHPQDPERVSVTLAPLLEQARNQLDSWDDTSVNLELETTIRDIKTHVGQILAQKSELTTADTRSINAIVDKLDASRQQNQKDAVAARLNSLEQMIGSLSSPGFSFWSSEPWRFLEVLFWALAGVLVNMIIVNGRHLRWRKFYRENVIIQLSHIATIPILVLVVALLVSLVTMKITLPGGNGIELDLSDSSILVALAFLLGARPWSIWRFIKLPTEHASPKF